MSNNITCIIIDDEPKAIELLKDCLTDLYKNVTILGTYTSGSQALDALRENQCDIVFLDISMPGKSGLDLMKLLPNLESEVIFVTAHSDYALDAFKYSAAGYVLKPIDDAELATAVDNAIERIINKKLAQRSNTPAHNNVAINPKIGIPNNNGIDYVNVNEILYFETLNKYTKVVTQHSELLSSYNIGKFKDLLEAHAFYQVHRSYIINLNCIRRYESNGVVIMTDNKEIPVSKNVCEDFLNFFSRVQK